MKTRTLMITATIAAVLNCAPVNAQVLGGGVTGGLGGTLSGGTRNMDMMTRGGADGSFGADLDRGAVRDRATGVTGRVGNRARSTVGDVRARADHNVGEARGSANAAARTGVGAATGAASTVNHVDSSVGSSANAAGSLASAASIDGNEVAGAVEASKQMAVQPQIDAGGPVAAMGATTASDGRIGSDVQQDHEAVSSLSGASEKVGVDGDAEGSASGNASASKKGVSAQSSASAEGSASVSRR